MSLTRPFLSRRADNRRSIAFALTVFLITFLATTLTLSLTSAAFASTSAAPDRVAHRSIDIEGVSIAYREAGDPENPTIVLLHGFPTSSQMFAGLIPSLAERYHVLAPDYPGYGASAMPDRSSFDYSFANFAALTDAFLEAQDVSSYALYVMDYGAPVGFRLFTRHPERVTAFVIQNGNAYEQGLREFWDPIKAYWAEPSAANRDALRGLLTIDATRWQYVHGVGNPETVSPDNWHTDQYLLDRPGNAEIQLDMFLDYGTNVTEYPRWQALFREHQPPTLIVWGQNDQIFPADGAYPYRDDLENIEFHLLDTGHFALEEYGDFIAARMLIFFDRELAGD